MLHYNLSSTVEGRVRKKNIWCDLSENTITAAFAYLPPVQTDKSVKIKEGTMVSECKY